MSQRLQRFESGKLSFDVLDEGPIDGETIVLLHGFPQAARSWDRVCTLLHERGFRTVRFDQRGYARGARPRGRFAYRLSALVGDVVALVHAAGGRPVHLVGHDWGAAVAWSVAARHPSLVRTLTAASMPHPRAFLRSMLSSDQALRSYYIGLFQVPLLAELILRKAPKHTHHMMRVFGMTDEQAGQVQSAIAEGDLLGGINWYRGLVFGNPLFLKSVESPTTFVWSSGDIALGRRGAELCGECVTGPYRFELLSGTHWIPEQQPERLSQIIAERAGGQA
jgi:pimeloyl-ACP methyl ester carboxylesterase